jgi:Ca2+-dependent lipid-binding protein
MIKLIAELWKMFVTVNCSCVVLAGFNPRWNQKMNFSLKVPELAMVHFAVKDSSTTGKNAMLGMYALPFSSMQQGELAEFYLAAVVILSVLRLRL